MTDLPTILGRLGVTVEAVAERIRGASFSSSDEALRYEALKVCDPDNPTAVAALLHLCLAAQRKADAEVARRPGFIQAQDTEWDQGVEYAKTFCARAILSRPLATEGGDA